MQELEFSDYLIISIEKRNTKKILDFINKKNNRLEKREIPEHIKRVKNCEKKKIITKF